MLEYLNGELLLPHNATKKAAAKAINYLQEIHNLSICHGDTAMYDGRIDTPRNLMLLTNGDVKWFDFEHSSTNASSEDLKEEIATVSKLIGPKSSLWKWLKLKNVLSKEFFPRIIQIFVLESTEQLHNGIIQSLQLQAFAMLAANVNVESSRPNNVELEQLWLRIVPFAVPPSYHVHLRTAVISIIRSMDVWFLWRMWGQLSQSHSQTISSYIYPTSPSSTLSQLISVLSTGDQMASTPTSYYDLVTRLAELHKDTVIIHKPRKNNNIVIGSACNPQHSFPSSSRCGDLDKQPMPEKPATNKSASKFEFDPFSEDDATEEIQGIIAPKPMTMAERNVVFHLQRHEGYRFVCQEACSEALCWSKKG
ncbi:hypothetical protein BDQ12DRAFT_670026 [Crucibulum laeve]|uniref:Uncharacterized protein n=1 Tax=Crucibulum laeve TaxID=68775 RepID=A0A5C3LY47_9AGAR|nr:hypothetical protein BDQ12DRAFT_670026 [Crucibulum laeve]